MGTSIIGQVRDKITNIARTAGTGAPGTIDTYTVYTECSPSGAGTFQVQNGSMGKSLTSTSEINGTQLLAKINEIGQKNIVAIFGRPTSGGPTVYTKYEYTSMNDIDGNATSVRLTYIDDNDVAHSTVPTINIMCCIVYYETGEQVIIPQGLNLGNKTFVAEFLTAALNEYKTDFSAMVGQYPFCFSKLSGGFCFAFPHSITETSANVYTAHFQVIHDGLIKEAVTEDSGSTWEYKGVSTNWGTQTLEGALTNSYYLYRDGFDAQKSLYPSCFATVDGKQITIFPLDASGTSMSFRCFYDNEILYAKTIDGASNWTITPTSAGLFLGVTGASLNTVLTSALDVYKNDFSSTVKKYPFCFVTRSGPGGEMLQPILPIVISESSGVYSAKFLVIDEGGYEAIYSTTNSGTTWVGERTERPIHTTGTNFDVTSALDAEFSTYGISFEPSQISFYDMGNQMLVLLKMTYGWNGTTTAHSATISVDVSSLDFYCNPFRQNLGTLEIKLPGASEDVLKAAYVTGNSSGKIANLKMDFDFPSLTVDGDVSINCYTYIPKFAQ